VGDGEIFSVSYSLLSLFPSRSLASRTSGGRRSKMVLSMSMARITSLPSVTGSLSGKGFEEQVQVDDGHQSRIGMLPKSDVSSIRLEEAWFRRRRYYCLPKGLVPCRRSSILDTNSFKRKCHHLTCTLNHSSLSFVLSTIYILVDCRVLIAVLAVKYNTIVYSRRVLGSTSFINVEVLLLSMADLAAKVPR